jgi:hypothetical protein
MYTVTNTHTHTNKKDDHFFISLKDNNYRRRKKRISEVQDNNVITLLKNKNRK